MKKRNTLEAKYVVLIVLLALVIILVSLSLLINENRKLSFFEKVIKDSGVFVQKIIYSPIYYIDEKLDKYKNLKQVYEENKKLKDNIEKYDLLKTENEALKKEVAEMKKELLLEQTLSDYTYLHAVTIYRNVGYWFNTITIDKGSYQGIEKDMIVINNLGLVGRIVKTSYFTSEVKLITTNDLNYKVAAGITVDDRSIHGLISGYDDKKQLLIMDGVVEKAIFEKGMNVYTTGLGGVFPSGLLIGQVVDTIIDQYGLAEHVLIKPSIDVNNIHFVTILKKGVQ